LRLGVFLAVLAFASTALAEKADRDKPTQIEANKMTADDARRLTIFDGNVVLTRGTIRLTADRVVVRQDAEGFQYATATGKPARFRQRQDAKPPETEGQWMEGEALRMEMDDKNSKIELYDNAHVKRGGDEHKPDGALVHSHTESLSRKKTFCSALYRAAFVVLISDNRQLPSILLLSTG